MNKKIVATILTAVIFCGAQTVHAERIRCNEMEIDNVTVQGPRDDNHFFQNRLTIRFKSFCGGKDRVHAALDHPAFNGFLSIALAAKASGKPLNIAVNTSDSTSASNQIAYLSIAE